MMQPSEIIVGHTYANGSAERRVTALNDVMGCRIVAWVSNTRRKPPVTHYFGLDGFAEWAQSDITLSDHAAE